MTQPPLVVISILNWNGWQDTLECLESARKLDYPNYLTVVVDNGSWNDSADRIKAWAKENLGPGHVLAAYARETALAGGEPETEKALDATPSPRRMVLIRNEENLGFSGGSNVAIHYALTREPPADYVFQLNNDTVAKPDCLKVLVSVARNAGAGTTGAMIMDASGATPLYPNLQSSSQFLFSTFVRGPRPLPETGEDFWDAPAAHGEAMLVSAAALRDVYSKRSEYLNESLFMYLDEFDFHFHARSLGHRTIIARRAFVNHKRYRSSEDNSLRAAYYISRNQIFLANLVLPRSLKAAFHVANIALLPVRILRLALGGRFSVAKVVAAAQVDGYRGIGGKWKHHDPKYVRPGPGKSKEAKPSTSPRLHAAPTLSPLDGPARDRSEGASLTVIIPTRGRASSLATVLNSLAAQTLPAGKYEVVVGVDGYDPATEGMLQSIRTPYPLRWFSRPHRGTAAARNVGVAAARAPLLVFMDDDILATPHFLESHYAAHKREPGIVVLGALKPPPEAPATLGRAVDWTQSYCDRCSRPGYQPVWTDLVGNNFSVAKEAVLSAGGWDEAFAGYGGGEDRDLAFRLGQLGLRFRFAADALGYHNHKKSWAQVLDDVRQSGRCHPLYLEKHPEELAHMSWAASTPLRRLLFRAIGLCPEFAFIALGIFVRIAGRTVGTRLSGNGRWVRLLGKLSVDVVFLRGIWEDPKAARKIFLQLTERARRIAPEQTRGDVPRRREKLKTGRAQ